MIANTNVTIGSIPYTITTHSTYWCVFSQPEHLQISEIWCSDAPCVPPCTVKQSPGSCSCFKWESFWNWRRSGTECKQGLEIHGRISQVQLIGLIGAGQVIVSFSVWNVFIIEQGSDKRIESCRQQRHDELLYRR